MSDTPKLVQVDPVAHRDLKFDPDSAIRTAADHHIIGLKINEFTAAASQYPIFLTRGDSDANWSVSSMHSFEINANLFVDGNQWTGSYLPLTLQTYPFFLMAKEGSEKEYSIGLQESNPAFSTTEGEPLFESDEKASPIFSRITAQLQADLNNEVHTVRFTRMLEQYGLIAEKELVIHHSSGTVSNLKGLHTVDEQALQALEDDKLLELRKQGYLVCTYSLVTSIYQLNALLQKHNQHFGEDKGITNIQLQNPKKEEPVTAH